MKQRLQRVLRGRSGFVLGLVLIVAALVAPDEGRADPATLILKDVCSNPAVVFGHQWASAKYNASDLYFMKDDGSVVRVSQGDGDFKDYEDLYVFGHGDGTSVGGMNYTNFVDGLETAHPTAPKSVFFSVCHSATSPSLLKAANDKYLGKVDKLTGSDGACRVTGNGDRDLTKAVLRVGSAASDQEKYKQIVKNILAKWNGSVYPGIQKVYGAYCRDVLANFDAGTLRAFMAKVITEFSQIDQDTKTSTDYIELMVLNTGGQAPTVCGQDPKGDGVAVACP